MRIFLISLLPREELANIVGTATESVIRLLSEFKSDKLVELNGRKIKILNTKGLEKIIIVMFFKGIPETFKIGYPAYFSRIVFPDVYKHVLWLRGLVEFFLRYPSFIRKGS